VPSCSALLACPARRSPGLPPGPRPLLALLLPSLAGPACCTSWLPPSARAAAPAQLAPWPCSLKEPHAHAWIESPLDALCCALLLWPLRARSVPCCSALQTNTVPADCCGCLAARAGWDFLPKSQAPKQEDQPRAPLHLLIFTRAPLLASLHACCLARLPAPRSSQRPAPIFVRKNRREGNSTPNLTAKSVGEQNREANSTNQNPGGHEERRAFFPINP